MDTQPPIDYYGQSIPRFRRRSWDGPADWTFLFRSGRGNDTRFKNHNHTYKHPLVIALALRKQGKGIKQIGKHLGCNHGHVSAMIKPFGLDVDVKAATNPQLDRLGMWAGYAEAEIVAQARADKQHGRWWREAYTATRRERYHANHKENKRIGAQRARARYAGLDKGSNEYIKRLLRTRIWKAVKMYSRSDIKPRKCGRTMDLVGCSAPALRNYLESKFTKGMGWHNQGEWHIDHIRPCCTFDLSDPKQQAQCFHYSNLQPLWAHENLSKNASWDGQTTPGL